MSDTTRDLLIRGIAAAKSGDRADAVRYLNWLLRYEPSMEEKKEAWYWLSEVTIEKAEKRSYLEEILAYDPWDGRARRALAIIDGKLNPAEIINPDKLQPQSAEGDSPVPTPAKRHTCPQCGGRMTYTPDGQSLTCEFCDSRQLLGNTGSLVQAAPEQDFIIGLATAKGHLNAAVIREISCKGCGATFVLPPQNMSQACPYCQSNYVLDLATSKEVMLPNGLIPFKITADQARLALRAWFARQNFEERPSVARGQGVFLPAWCFDMGGTVQVRCQVQQQKEWVPHNDLSTVMRRDVLVLATKRLPEKLHAAMNRYDLNDLVPYDERFLSNWLAESYQVSMSDASLIARKVAYELQKQAVMETFDQPYRDISFSSALLQVESYQLVLLPAWVTSYKLGKEIYPILINGQSGEVIADKPIRTLSDFWERIKTS